MRGVSKKMLISILTSVIVFVTMVATTFAWVGIFTYANTDSFKINLKISELNSNYFLTISSNGKKGSFSDSVPTIDVERQIINNYYNNNYDNLSNSAAKQMFDKISLAPVSTTISDSNNFSSFEEVNYNSGALDLIESKDYYKFDLYLSVDTKEGITADTTGIKASVLLSNIEETLIGTINSDKFIDDNPFKGKPSNPIVDLLKTIPTEFKVDSKNACRIGMSIYDPINIEDEYMGNENPVMSFIYQGGNQLPSYDDITKVYDLGGCLPEDQNTALLELKKIRPDYSMSTKDLYYSKLNEAINRNDLTLTKDNEMIWNRFEHSKYLGCMNGIQTKMKLSIYFWFEGWDADCLKHIQLQPVTLNLTFSSGIED